MARELTPEEKSLAADMLQKARAAMKAIEGYSQEQVDDLARAVGTLAAAYAEAGRFDDAIATAQKACDLAEKSGEKDLLLKNQELLKLYRANRPFHELTSH